MATSRDEDVKPAHSDPCAFAVVDTRHPRLLIVVAASFSLMVVAACTSQPPESTTSTTSAPGPADSATADSLKSLEAQVDGLADRVREFGGRIDKQPRPEPIDLGPLRNKIDEIDKSTKGVASITKTIDSLESRLGDLDKSIAEIQSEVASLKLKSSTQPASGSLDKPADEAIAQGTELYKAGKFKEAEDIFLKVTQTNPDDARGWYFAALSSGFATGNWKPGDSDAARLVQKGVEREKAGTPDRAKIDSTFEKLNNATGKGWLEWYRKNARKS